MTYNPYAIPPLIAGCLNFALVYWVHKQAPAKLIRQTFILWNISLALWNFGIAVGYTWTDPYAALGWYRYWVATAVRFIGPFFLHFAVAITNTRDSRANQWAIRFSYFYAILFLVLGATLPSFIREVKHYFWGYYPLAEVGEMLFGIPFGFSIIYACRLLYKELQKATTYRRNQLKYVLAGAAIVYGCGATNFLPLYGIPVYPIGNLTNSAYSLLVAYAIMKHELMDIRVVLRRSTVYGALAGALTLVYLTIVSVFKRIFGHYGLEESYVYYTAAVPITVILAPPMKARLESVIENAPFWRTHHYHQILNDFGQSILTVLDLPVVLDRVIDRLGRVVETDQSAIYLYKPEEDRYLRVAQRGHPGPNDLPTDHPVVRQLSEAEAYCATGLNDEMNPSPHDPWPYALAHRLTIKGSRLGIVALGEKRSGDMFNSEDLRLLSLLADQAAVAISNAREVATWEDRQRALKETHDNVLIGMLATEIAHEVAKPLTRIINERTRLEKAVRSTARPLLQTIETEALRASEIMESFAMLSPQVALARQRVRLDQLTDEVVASLGLDDDDTIRIHRRLEFLGPMDLNSGQMFQVLTNLIQNAWQAMSQGGDLEISTRIRRIGGAPRVEIAVTDTGPGIPRDIQDKVFQPFFTTKSDRGGRGVGLTISRAMVERHGGKIDLRSPVKSGRGTTVLVYLPIASEEKRP